MVWPEVAKMSLFLRYSIPIPSPHTINSFPPIYETNSSSLSSPSSSLTSSKDVEDQEKGLEINNSNKDYLPTHIQNPEKIIQQMMSRVALVPDSLDLEDIIDCFLQSAHLSLPPFYSLLLPSGYQLFSPEFHFNDSPSCAEVHLKDLTLQIGDTIQISCKFENFVAKHVDPNPVIHSS